MERRKERGGGRGWWHREGGKILQQSFKNSVVKFYTNS